MSLDSFSHIIVHGNHFMVRRANRVTCTTQAASIFLWIVCMRSRHFIQRPCYQWRSPCQDPASNRTTRRPSDRRKETQTVVVWSCLPFIRSGQNHLARHSERWKKTRKTEKEVGRQHQGMDRPGVRQVPGGSEEQGKMEETGCEIICGAPTILAVKEWLIMMMMMG